MVRSVIFGGLPGPQLAAVHRQDYAVARFKLCSEGVEVAETHFGRDASSVKDLHPFFEGHARNAVMANTEGPDLVCQVHKLHLIGEDHAGVFGDDLGNARGKAESVLCLLEPILGIAHRIANEDSVLNAPVCAARIRLDRLIGGFIAAGVGGQLLVQGRHEFGRGCREVLPRDPLGLAVPGSIGKEIPAVRLGDKDVHLSIAVEVQIGGVERSIFVRIEGYEGKRLVDSYVERINGAVLVEVH
ncbi:hypothetical protein D9M72_433960 [compost metagenome]